MVDEEIIEHHQAQLIFHRILYGVLAICMFIIYCWNTKQATVDYLVLLLGTAVLAGVEVLFSKLAFFNRISVLQYFTFIQYVFYLIMIYRLHDNNVYLVVGMSALMLTFMFEFSYYNDIADDLMNTRCIFLLIFPGVVCMIINFCLHGVGIGNFLLLIVYLMLCVFDMLMVHLFYLNEHKLMKDIQVLLGQINIMEENNEDLTNVKERVEKVNEELNIQRVRLAQMNREIQQSNSELEIQTEILKFVNSSFTMDIPCIIEYMIDVIMRVRNAEFCGIYIDKDVCYNKNPICTCKYSSKPELHTFPDLDVLFWLAGNSEDDKLIIKQFPEEQFPIISQSEVRSVLTLPLVLDDVKYGIIVVGSKNEQVFDSAIRFYDTIVPQLDMAIHNIKMYAQMQHIAQTDGLTGIHNRVHFNKLFPEWMEYAVKNKAPLTVALFDIDKFKRINDTYGHLAGDEVIKTIARITSHHIEETEIGFICRYGGEEFVVALPNMGIDQALPIIQKLHEEIATTTVEAYGHIIAMNVSIGISSYPDICEDVNQLIKRADWSMYYAKEHGRGQIKVDGPDIQEGDCT